MQAGLFILFIYYYYFFHLLFLFYAALRVAFMGHWGGTLVAFTVLVGFYWALGLDVCGAFAAFVAFMRHAGWSVYFIYLFIYCMAWRGVALRVAFMGHWGGALVAFTAFGAFMRRLASHFLPISSVCSV